MDSETVFLFIGVLSLLGTQVAIVYVAFRNGRAPVSNEAVNTTLRVAELPA